jgi:TonB family protein
MNESTARAERYDLQTSTSSFFLWEVPQKPVAVRIPYQLMDRLEREAVESFRSVTSRGSEIGGLLIGSVAPGSPMIVSVAEYQVIDCEYSRGPLYRLSDADILRFQRAIEQRGASGIAGFFRTHTRKGISLDPDDLAVLDQLFREPHQFGLLVRPFATKASTGAIFIREGGKVNGESSYLEFPFRSPEGESQAPAEAPEAKAAPVAPPAPQAPAAKPAARAQIVPIASRREISLPPGAEEKAPEATAASAVAPAPSTAPVESAKQQEKGKIEKPAPKSEPKVAAKAEAKAAPAPKVEAKQEAKPAPKVDPKLAPKVEAKVEPKVDAKVEPKVDPNVTSKIEPKLPARPVETKKQEEKPAVKSAAAPAPVAPAAVEDAPKSGKGLKLVLAAAAATALFVLLFVYPGLLRQSSKSPSTANQGDTSALQLRVERTNGELLLTWNRDAATIKNATKAVLTINDGEQHENVEMDLAQLRNGSIVYSPQTADISFKMEVTGKDSTKTASESVRVLRTRPSPLQEQGAPQANGAGKPTPAATTTPAATPANTNNSTPTNNTQTAQTPDTNVQPESKPVVPTRSFNASSLGARLRPTQSTDLPDAPTVGGSAVPSAIPGVNLNTVGATPNAPAPPPVATPAPAPASPVANTTTATASKSGGQIQQAVLVSKKDPEYPKLARQTGARGLVKVSATVGKDGHVKSVKVISGHPMLQAAAVAAVKQWVYKPTLLNGQPVETDTEIVLNFVGDR